jgi:hypothetical protein
MNKERAMTSQIVRRAVRSGTVAGLLSAVVLAMRSNVENGAPLQPINATSHWLLGDEAASREEFDKVATPIGFGTHQLSAVFWALLFERLRGDDPTRGTTLVSAVATSVVAAGVDYGIVPKRITPGWELVVSNKSLVSAFVALGTGFVLSGLLSTRR